MIFGTDLETDPLPNCNQVKMGDLQICLARDDDCDDNDDDDDDDNDNDDGDNDDDDFDDAIDDDYKSGHIKRFTI